MLILSRVAHTPRKMGGALNKAGGAQPVLDVKNAAALAPVEDYLTELYERVSGLTGGKPADYIPELGKADPSLFGIALATVDGKSPQRPLLGVKRT